ncbi:hypothetical protein BU26DRAFT_547709 [Trematosphaeria pertusa]|uniref:Nineteen complex-related protein 2-domain-containing protein n=1 Tax=Trematosphaeria pertusa TaxID=390896 RepID=A0A6A6ISR5_9PLEO|nr:uncharacterized protein BU26DRAFT_547709 [Trematosphaeria pertusa]KAF2253148.1 hypothetical protein BU26DRAFT_547709 [Trematosphaeria pertusa]
MKRSGSGRIARKIGSYDDDSPDSASSSASEARNQPPQTVVKRPIFGKSKKRSSLRISFGPGESDANDGDESSDAAVATPKKSNLSRIAIEKNAQLRARSPLVPEASRPSLDEDRPSYSKDYLAELRNSTPTTPKDLKPTEEEEEETRALDIASKFGPTATISIEPETSAIPTEAEILEKKARRRRLAKEQRAYDEDDDKPWASDDDGDAEFRTHKNEISLRPKEKYAETRLVHEDEDMAEGFDEYVEDGKISLDRKSEREAEQKRRVEIAELIKDAEGGSDDDGSDDSEEERNAAFAAAQARAGRYGQKDQDKEDGARTPPRITPLPDLGEVLHSLQSDIWAKQQRREVILKKLEELRENKVKIEERRQYLQEQLQKTGEEYERLRQEAGMPALPANGAAGSKLITERGLDSLGTTPLATSGSSGESEDE